MIKVRFRGEYHTFKKTPFSLRPFFHKAWCLIGCLIFIFGFSGCAHRNVLNPLDEKLIALTFDDGPNSLYTPTVLQTLKEDQVKATFFVIGREAEKYPEILRQIHADGHQIGNHSQNHRFRLSILSSMEMEKEICVTQEIISKITGTAPTVFRAPFGKLSQELITSCRKYALPVIDGTIKPRDSSLPGKECIVSTVLDRTRPGSIIILHDGGGILGFKNRTQTLEALPEIIQGLKARGYLFVTINELLDYHLKSARSSAAGILLY